ncbi:MAG: glycosyltransferase family 39 protein [Nanoarchaeota archaeon]|nr:glycosyltransferase family 39 protein [Nanoarchaeota archaeon]
MKVTKIIKENEIFIVLFLLFILTLQNVLSSYYLSPTADELKHLTRGYVYLKTGDQRFNTVHPLLINSLNAVPLLFVKDINLPSQPELLKSNNVIEFAREFFFHSGNDLERMFSLARITTFMLSIILGIFVYLWAKKLYGALSGLFALFLYVTSPNIVAYSGLVTNDIGSALFIFLSMYTLWLFYKNPLFKNLLLSGFVFGLALMSKYYALHFIPAVIILLLIVYYSNKNKIIFYKFKNAKISNLLNILLMIFIFFFASWLTLNIGYKFDGTFRSIEYNVMNDVGVDKAMYSSIIEKSASYIPIADKETSLKSVKYVTSNVPIMFPYHYVKGVLVLTDITLERSNKQFYFFGKTFQKVPRYYYLIMFFLKVQIPMLIFLILTIIFYRKIKKDYIDDLFLIVPALIFSILFSISPVANGFRHFLPVLPLLTVFVSKSTNLKIKNQKLLDYAFIILILWFLIIPIKIFPYYIPYYNEFIGMDNGYKVSIHVDVDWGQDLKLLKRFMDDKGIKHIGLSYFGQVYPEYYNISYTYLPSIVTHINMSSNDVEDCTPIKGVVAISIANLEQPFLFKDEGCFEWLKGLEPIYRVGYTIYIFNVSQIK